MTPAQALALLDAGPEGIARLIDHTLLRPDATVERVSQLCREAAEWEFAAVCVHPHYVERVVRWLRKTRVAVATVVGFPLGATTTLAKVVETREAILQGAREIDMVMNIGAFKSGELHRVSDEIRTVVAIADDVTVKVILENALLTAVEKEETCRICVDAGAHFVKTSTGFQSGGATVEDVALMRRVVGERCGVKASGGIRDLDTLRRMVMAGATRIGTSSGVAILTQAGGNHGFMAPHGNG